MELLALEGLDSDPGGQTPEQVLITIAPPCLPGGCTGCCGDGWHWAGKGKCLSVCGRSQEPPQGENGILAR